MYTAMKDQLAAELEEIRQRGHCSRPSAGFPRRSPATSRPASSDGPDAPVLNFCANNYLGLADHPDIIAAAKDAMDERGFGMACVRFICGTQDLHLELEARVSAFLGTEDTILFSSCFDANGGVFESLFGPEDAVISDALNHASIIDGIRLCKAQRLPLRQPGHGGPGGPAAGGLTGDARPAARSSSPTASSRWTASSPRWPPSATSRTSTTPW